MVMDFERIQNKKLSRLCLNFKQQAQIGSLESKEIWAQAELHPWIDSHPWIERGIPQDLTGAIFSVQSDIREEFARVAATYNPEEAKLYAEQALYFRQLLDKQSQRDMDFLLKHGEQSQQRSMLQALNLFYETHADDVNSPYYDTRAIGSTCCMARNIEVFLEQGYQAVYGTRNF
jgi:hypothetical protein